MNMRCEKLNWDQVDLEERGWIDNFDLVFGVMCPATRSREALIKMSSASRGILPSGTVYQLGWPPSLGKVPADMIPITTGIL